MVAVVNQLKCVCSTLFLGATLALIALSGCNEQSRGRPLGPTETLELTIDGEKQTYAFETLDVTIGDRTFNMKLALTDRQRYNGLSHMTNEQIGDGMLFAFRQPRRLAFVMRDCLVPIDIVFISPTGRVIQTHRMQTEAAGTPERMLTQYPSGFPAIAAMEFQAGTIDELGIKEGMAIDLPLDRLKQRAE